MHDEHGSKIRFIVRPLSRPKDDNEMTSLVDRFLMAQSYAGFVVLYAWVSNTFPRPPSKRAVSLALVNAFSQLGNVAGSYVWASSWGPTYRKSYAICISSAGCAIGMCYVMKVHLESVNRRLDREEEGEGGEGEGEGEEKEKGGGRGKGKGIRYWV